MVKDELTYFTRLYGESKTLNDFENKGTVLTQGSLLHTTGTCCTETLAALLQNVKWSLSTPDYR